MSNTQSITVLFPPGRIVQGSLYKAQDKDMDGRPRVYPPNHPKAGQPKITYFFAVAYAKSPGATHWASEVWGQPIWALGHNSWPQGQAQRNDFAWKITDGDSQVPNKRNRKPCDNEGFPGHWVVGFSSSYPPKIFTRDNSGRPVDLITPDAVKPGYYVQVQGTILSNETSGNPGIYINHNMVMLVGYGAEIRQGADPNSVEWSSALPPGASAVPLGGAMPVNTPPAPGATPPAPGSAPLPPGAAPAAPAAPPTPVVPSASFIAPPAPGAAPAPAAPPAPPAAAAPPPGPQMTAKAGGITYAQYIAAGWTDATLRQQGYMV